MSIGFSQSAITRFILWRFAWKNVCYALQRHFSASLPNWLLSWFTNQQLRVAYSCAGQEIAVKLLKGTRDCLASASKLPDGDGWRSPEAGARIEAASRGAIKMLVVPDSFILTQELKLPLLSLVDLRNAIANNLQTWTPFSAEEVFFDARVEELKQDVAYIKLLVLPRARLTDLEETCGVQFDEITLDGSIVPVAKEGRKGEKFKRLNLFLVAMMLSLGIVGYGLVQNRLDHAIQQLSIEKNNLVKDLQVQKSVEDKLSLLLNQAAFLDDRQKYHQPLLPVMAQLAGVLPANVSLGSFELLRNEGSITVLFQEPPSDEFLRSILLQCNACKNEYARIDEKKYEFYFKLGGR